MVPPHGLEKEGSTPLSPFQVHRWPQLEEFSRVWYLWTTAPGYIPTGLGSEQVLNTCTLNK